MKVTVSILSLLLSTVSMANATYLRDLQTNIGSLYQITHSSTVQSSQTIVSTFSHSDVTNREGNGNGPFPADYGTVQATLFNVVDQTCYRTTTPGAGDGTGCICATDPVELVNFVVGGAVIGAGTPVTTDVTGDNLAQSVLTVSLADLLASDANNIVGNNAFVAYCVRLSLMTKDTTPATANSQDVLVLFNGINNVNTVFDVFAQPETSDNGGTITDTFTVTPRLCATGANDGSSSTSPLLEGNAVRICIESDDDPLARIINIDSWTWRVTADGQIGGSPVATQNAIANGGPSNALTTKEPCLEVGGKSVCEFQTLFGTAIYDKITAATTKKVFGSGVVVMRFNGQANRRVRVLLSAGDTFVKDAAVGVTLAGRAADNDKEECTGFFLFCWIAALLSCF